MQYRAWFRQTQTLGPLLPNLFTSEPNRPHLLVLFPYFIGQVARATGLTPEQVYAYAGSVIVIGLMAVLFATVRRFVANEYQRWWIFGALVVGGGAGAHVKFLAHIEAVKNSPVFTSLLFDPLTRWPAFEDYRGHYVFTTIFDSHFLVLWTLTTTAILSLAATLRRFRPASLAVTLALVLVTTLVHVYEGVTLVAIVVSMGWLLRLKRLLDRHSALTLASVGAVAVVCLGWFAWLMAQSGIPTPTWRALVILPTILFVAYPLAWILIFRGLATYWRGADRDSCILLGWALGCTLVTLSGPFYAYPDRGTLTLQIPLTILAGLIYFRAHPRVSWRAAGVAVAVLGATAVWYMARVVARTTFDPDRPAIYLNDGHGTMLTAIRQHAASGDLLLADAASLLWIAPEYPGIHYCGHFFLTVDYERKRREVEAFFRGTPSEQEEFLRRRGVRFVFVSTAEDPSRFEPVAGLRRVVQTSAGAFFEYLPGPDR
jgi:hypothetical protein